ncbi:MAG: YceI family protein [Bacteroidia bacterium]
MQNLRFKTAAFLLVGLFAFGFTGPETNFATYKADPAASTIKWKAAKVTGEHFGSIQLKEGAFEYSDGKLIGGSFTVNMQTITVEDIKDPGMNGKLTGHLKSDDFFGVEKYPTSTFVVKQVVSRGKPGEYKVIGDITIKGITKEIRFNAVVDTDASGKLHAKADIALDRTDYNVRYGSGSFFDDLGDRTIYDEFTLSIDVVGTEG